MKGHGRGTRKLVPRQMQIRVENTCANIIKKNAGGNIANVNMGMVRQAASKDNMSVAALVTRLRQLGAQI